MKEKAAISGQKRSQHKTRSNSSLGSREGEAGAGAGVGPGTEKLGVETQGRTARNRFVVHTLVGHKLPYSFPRGQVLASRLFINNFPHS